jgi:ligand-binding sensor domain-containing protein/signal transduction histidine kinase
MTKTADRNIRKCGRTNTLRKRLFSPKIAESLIVVLLLLAIARSISIALATTAPSGTAQNSTYLAQDNDIRFEHISIEQGLSHSSVTCILQDRAGFMWFGTADGLNRFDGYHFTVYDHDPEDPNSLGNNFVRALYQDRGGDLWVATDGGGLNRFDRETGTFSRHQAVPGDPHSLSSNTVWSIYEDRYGTLWIGTDVGLDQFDRETETIAPFQSQILQGRTTRSTYQDLSGLFWVGTDEGLFVFDQESASVTHYRNDPLNPRSLSNNSVQIIYQDRSGVLWIGTDDGLNKFNRENAQFTHYRSDPRNPRSLSDNSIRTIYEDRSGALWIGTAGGLDKLDRSRESFVHYRNTPGNPSSLSSNQVLAIFEDQEGVLWIGTQAGGFNKSYAGERVFAHYRHDPASRNSLSSNIIRAIYEDGAGILWIGTADGLNRLDRTTGEFTRYYHNPYDENSLSDDFVLAIHGDHAGALWIGTLHGGLDRFDPETEGFFHYRNKPKDPLSLSNNTVRVIYEDQAGVLWIGTNDGLNRFEPETGTFTQYAYQYTSGTPKALSSNDIRAIFQDRAGILWVGTADGLNRVDTENKQVTYYPGTSCSADSLCGNLVLSIAEDNAGALWIGTFQGGLNRLDRETGRFVHYREKDGLANDVVNGILADSQGNLWLSTNQGLSRFTPETETFKNFDVRDGLQSNEFTGGAYHQGASEEIFFGGINGFNAFFPDLVAGNSYLPPIVLTSFTQSGGAVETGGVPESIQEITLRWPNNFFEFEFAALSFVRPEENQYAYLLEGFDEDWNQVGTRRFGKYTNLPGKTYTLRVKGSNNDGLWNEEGLSVKITIVPPFWATWWFRGAAVLLLVGAVVGGYRLRVRSIEARSRELEEQVEQRTTELRREIDQRTKAEEALRQSEMEKAVEAERSRLARELHDAVTQTLFSASLLAEALPTTWERDREEGHQILNELRLSTRGVLAEMRTLLLELRPAALIETSLGDLLHQLAEATKGREGLSVTVTVNGRCLLPPDVHIALYRIVQEALNNVTKHARASQVSIDLRCTPPSSTESEGTGSRTGNRKVELYICDDGRGFDPSSIPPNCLGLGIMRERAEALGATFVIKSQPGQGTQIAIVWLELEGERHEHVPTDSGDDCR